MSDDTPSKRCSSSQCSESNPQPVTAFSRNRRTRDGLQNECKACMAKRGAAWREREPSYLREYYADNREQRIEYQQHYQAELSAIVFNHYGWQCACHGCGSTDLCIDHVNGDGAQHRVELYGHPTRYHATMFYRWLIDNEFPDGYQTLCRPCNSSKRTGTHCRLHAVKK